MSVEENKVAMRRWFGLEDFQGVNEAEDPKAALEKTLRKVLSEISTPELVVHDTDGDIHYKNFIQSNIAFLTAFPDISFSIEDMVAEGDRVAIRSIGRGTHTQSYAGMPPTGKKVELNMIGIGRFVDGKMVEVWRIADRLGMMQQLGPMPSK
jgi:predicted ester cyclase